LTGSAEVASSPRADLYFKMQSAFDLTVAYNVSLMPGASKKLSFVAAHVNGGSVYLANRVLNWAGSDDSDGIDEPIAVNDTHAVNNAVHTTARPA
jgi:hypothetical protein